MYKITVNVNGKWQDCQSNATYVKGEWVTAHYATLAKVRAAIEADAGLKIRSLCNDLLRVVEAGEILPTAEDAAIVQRLADRYESARALYIAMSGDKRDAQRMRTFSEAPRRCAYRRAELDLGNLSVLR